MAARRVEPEQQVLDAVVAEFEASCANKLDMFVYSSKVIGGAAEYCGTHADPAHWTLAYVRDDRALLPLAVGERDRVVLEYARLDKAGTPIWDPDKFPMPTVIVDGAAYHFTPSHGRVLLGQVKLERRAVLLAAIDDMLAVIHLAGRTRSILHIGKPHSFRELDVDRLLRAQGRTRPRSQQVNRSSPVRPPPSIEAEHQRIVYGLAVDVGTGPSIAQVLAGCFEDAADRARALKVLPARTVGGNKSRADTEDSEEAKPSERRARGKMWVRPVCRRFFRLAIRGHGNIIGRVSEIVDTLKFYFPDLNISCDAMSDVLNLLRGLGTCLVDREEGERIWTINLAGLRDPRSALHGRLCRETVGWHPLDAAAMAAIEGADNSKLEPPTATTTHPAGVGAVRARVEAAPVLEVDIKAALEVLAELPPSAAPELLASTLSKPAAPAPERRHAPPAETVSPTAMTPPVPPAQDGASPDAAPPAASVPAAAPVSAPSPAPTQEPSSEDAALRESAPEQGHVGDEAVNIDADSRSPPKSGHVGEGEAPGGGGDIADVVDELHGLPPPAARTLLLGARVFSKQLEAATGHGEAHHGVETTSPDASPHGQSAKFPRRRLHLSPDHTLAVVAGVPPGSAIATPAQTRDVMLGLGYPVGDSPPGGRASPRS